MLSRNLEGQRVNMKLAMKALIPQETSSEWTDPDPATSVVKTDQDRQGLSAISRGAATPRSLIRIDFVPSGEPSWLPLVTATDVNDVIHTYGIDRLFEGFRNQAKNNPVPMGRLFLVAN
jgi:hypothetical protein